jgi:hypothetical protein
LFSQHGECGEHNTFASVLAYKYFYRNIDAGLMTYCILVHVSAMPEESAQGNFEGIAEIPHVSLVKSGTETRQWGLRMSGIADNALLWELTHCYIRTVVTMLNSTSIHSLSVRTFT